MAERKVIWTGLARQDRKEILRYWKIRNKSSAYSHKLRKLFKEAIRQIVRFPDSGSPTQVKNVRVKIIRDYLIVYKVIQDEIFILSIWDSRRNPESLKKRLD